MLNFFLLNSDFPPPIYSGILVHYCIFGEKYLNVFCLHGKVLIIPLTYQLVYIYIYIKTTTKQKHTKKTHTTISKLKSVRKERLETRVQITSKNLQKYSHTTLTAVATACPHTDMHMQ